jgi:xanthine/uracil permease
VAGAVVLICIGLALVPFIQRGIANKKAENQAEDYIEKEKGHLNLGPEGWSMGEKEVR